MTRNQAIEKINMELMENRREKWRKLKRDYTTFYESVASFGQGTIYIDALFDKLYLIDKQVETMTKGDLHGK